MTRGRQRTNLFYVLLIVIGVMFTVTASAYFVLALHGTAAPGAAAPPPSGLLSFLDRRGAQLLAVELAALALATVGAIGTDSWSTSAASRPPRSERSTDDQPS